MGVTERIGHGDTTSIPAFVLIHGAAHSGRSWEYLAAALVQRGYRSYTPDMPIDDLSCGLADCARAVANGIPANEQNLIVVGHSVGGVAVPVVADLLAPRVRAMVFLAAVVPTPGRAWIDTESSPLIMPAASRRIDELGRSHVSDEWARELFFTTTPPDVADVADVACSQLRPTSPRLAGDPSPVAVWPNVACWYISCEKDRCVSPEWGRRVSLERFGRPRSVCVVGTTRSSRNRCVSPIS